LLKSALKLTMALVLIGIIGIVLLSRYVLLIFGKNYALNSVPALDIMAFTGIFIGINNLGSSLMKIRHQIRVLVFVNIGYLIVTMAFVYWWLHFGIDGAAWALAAGQAFLSVEYLVFYVTGRKKVATSAS
jgi:O-antigen/teichoic acid export membrane protein